MIRANTFQRISAAAIVRGVCLAACGLVSSALTGCGGAQDYGGMQSNLGGDINGGYGSSLATSYRGANKGPGGLANALDRGAYPMIETSFQLGSIPGDPFDYEKVNVQVSIKKADGSTISVPAFFDGGTTWRVRYTPTAPGPYGVVDVKLNGATVHEDKLEKKDWTVSGTPKPGFVRVDKGNHSQFVFDNGAKFYPLGHNVAWLTDPKSSYTEVFGKMHAAGENWSRVWLDQRDGKHLDCAMDNGKPKPGAIDLDEAKRWDTIVSSAEKSDVYFQLVLENSDSLSSANGFSDSSNIHPAWDKNPLNTANGGFLKSPDAFFVDPASRSLEKRKIYYILARWGYSPNIMGLELFHDAESTDAAYGKHWDDIALWHHEMAIFTKTNDANHHLLTTSSAPGIALDSQIWETVDYVQARAYSADLVNSLANLSAPTAKKLDKPYLVSEFGSPDASNMDQSTFHAALWSGILAGGSGAAQLWDWDAADKQNLYDDYRAAGAFVTASSLAEHPGLPTAALTIETSQKGALSFGPGGTSGASAPTEFVVGTETVPAGMDKLPPALEGKAGGGKPLSFQVSYAQAGSFSVSIGQVSKAGALLKVSMDGKTLQKEFAAAKEAHAPAADAQSVRLEVPAGSHTITVSNDGPDWVSLKRFTLGNYAPALAGVARASKDYAIAWIYNRDGVEAEGSSAKSGTPATGTVKLTALQKGKYTATWWDTHSGRTIDSTEVEVMGGKSEVALSTPPITQDVALFITRAGTQKAKVAKGKGSRRDRNGNNGAATAAPVVTPNTAPTGANSAAGAATGSVPPANQ